MAEGEESSSSNESGGEGEELVAKALNKYYSELGESKEPLDLLQFTSNDRSCLICLSGIKRAQAVWSCGLCYCLFHLVCIQQWARDGVAIRNPILSEDLFPNVSVHWTCPKCRGQYDQRDSPTVYRCFCGKQDDPSPDPWLLPHSCGELCGRELVTNCGHKCVSLCHPGPCPPCPKTVLVSCYCQQSHPRSQRCGFTGWSCSMICRRTLSCGLHTCEQRCHKGPCEPCAEKVTSDCLCGKETREQPCDEPMWSCGKICGKHLPCGHHSCRKVCHSGSCGNCPRSGVRTCPCGKKEFVLDCTAEIPCCGDTCSKSLNCGRHQCVRQCHLGDCGPCLQRADKFCRCGQKKKSVSCNQIFLCENKCSNTRQCGRHQCRRKCCNGDCPPCEQVCGRLLGCKTHKCAATCHSGRCYPCVLTVSVACACGKTISTVSCGLERVTKPPRCNELCNKPLLCHHTRPPPHRCHFGECPPCKQTCSLPLPCGHPCSEVCHSRPSLSQVKPAAPWKKLEPSLVVRPCPPCSRPISRACHGGHEVTQFPCFRVQDYSCGRLCGRTLKCGNHTCKRGCHVVVNASTPTSSGEDCLECREVCRKPRHPDCPHTCSSVCHSGACPPCDAVFKMPCHCSSIHVYIKCSEWCAADDRKRDDLRTCNSVCSKMLSCGHHCPQSCHAGPCASVDQCRRKITVRCPCRRIKKEWRCNQRQEVLCDEDCFLAEQRQAEASIRAAADALILKEKREKEAIAAIERQLRPRKRKRTSAPVDENRDRNLQSFKIYVLKVVLVGLMCLTLTFVIYKNLMV